MTPAAKLVKSLYRKKLRAAGVPRRPSDRTPEQDETAGLLFWAALTEIQFDAQVARSSLEVQ